MSQPSACNIYCVARIVVILGSLVCVILAVVALGGFTVPFVQLKSETKPDGCIVIVTETDQTKAFHYHRELWNRTDTAGLLLVLRKLVLEYLELQKKLSPSQALFHALQSHIQATEKTMKLLREDQLRQGIHLQNGGKEQEICPESYNNANSTLANHPLFRTGFFTVNCSDFVPMRDLVTVLMRAPRILGSNVTWTELLLDVTKGIAKHYPKVRLILATETPVSTETKSFIEKLDIQFENVTLKGAAEAEMWASMMKVVRTPYVLVARHLTDFDDDVNLERLVRVLGSYKNVVIAGGSYRNSRAEWDMGCQQTTLTNWTASYTSGYYHSFNECVVCDFMPGPWVAKTQALKDLDAKLENGMFRDLFWRLKSGRNPKFAVSCPDVMFNVDLREEENTELVSFANKHEVHKIVEANGRVHWYGCRHGYPHAHCSKEEGLALSPSTMENLADAIKFTMRQCENAGIYCEIQDSTLLGAVKLGGILPWDHEASIAFLMANFSALENLQSTFAAAGYRLLVKSRRPHMRMRKLAPLEFSLVLRDWNITMTGSKFLESALVASTGKLPTRVNLAGQWVNVMRNPGLYVRNRYRSEVYRHQPRGPGHAKRFARCPERGHSACLDRYSSDGSIQFRRTIRFDKE